MHTWENQILKLSLPSRIDLLPVVLQCVSTVAGVFGLGKDEALELSLAAEEIFVYLCKELCRGENIEIECLNGLYFTRVEFHFTASVLNLGGLNIASTMTGDIDAKMEQIGLLIAARSVSRFNIVAEKQNRICLTIDREKTYPQTPDEPLRMPDSVESPVSTVPDAETLKQFAMRVAHAYPAPQSPPFFSYPGKVADMVASGDYDARVVGAPKGDIAGGILFKFRTDKNVQIFGPFVFLPSAADEISKMLVDDCIYKVARSGAVGLMCLNGAPALMASHFEPLGVLNFKVRSGENFPQPCYYRLLHEDPGAVVWTHTALCDYLDREYRRLALAREIKVVRDLGETRSGVSIFSAAVERGRSTITLRPLWPGPDFADNVERHAHMLQKERIRNVFFVLDLGVPWHASLTPALLANQFRPEIVLPFAGLADLVVFQRHA